MTTTTTSALIELPHSGLRVPDNRLRVTAYKGIATHDGFAFTATLRYDGKVVGIAENGGNGGPTGAWFNNSSVFGDAQLNAYAARCRSETGDAVTAEDLLDELVTEYEFATKIRQAEAKGRAVVRRMEYLVGGDGPEGEPFPYEDTTCRTPATPAQRAALVAQLEMLPVSEHGWWQLWTGERWEDLTPRSTSA